MDPTPIIIDMQAVEIDGKHYVSMKMNGREMKRRGPYPTAAAARDYADRLARHWQARAANLPPWLQAAPGVLDVDAVIALGRSLKHKL
jgi:hypothetical protein